MPRNGSSIYSIPPGTEGFPDTTIESEKYNNYIHDVETDLNTPRPVVAGGTGSSSADGALTNLSAEKANQVVANFDSHTWMSGSFYSSISATGPPIAGHEFAGIVYKTNSGDFIVEARDVSTGFIYIRLQTSGVWGTWERSNAPVTAASSPPTGIAALDNSLWWDTDSGVLYLRFNDGTGPSQWVVASPQPDFSVFVLDAPNDAKVYGRQSNAWSDIGVLIPNTSVVVNGDFRVNQGGYGSAAVLNAGSYGHDQWKAGASGGDYSFTQLKSSTQITIASGKSLIQPIEDVNVVGGSYVLTWTGTAQARAGVNTLTPTGAYAASPLSIVGQTAGTVMSIEFNNGTLSTVKLESGTTATPFIMRPYDQELATCQRYFQTYGSGVSYELFAPAWVSTSILLYAALTFQVRLRASPTLGFTAANTFLVSIPVASGTPASISIASASPTVAQIQCPLSGATPGHAGVLQANAATGARITVDARL